MLFSKSCYFTHSKLYKIWLQAISIAPGCDPVAPGCEIAASCRVIAASASIELEPKSAPPPSSIVAEPVSETKSANFGLVYGVMAFICILVLFFTIGGFVYTRRRGLLAYHITTNRTDMTINSKTETIYSTIEKKPLNQKPLMPDLVKYDSEAVTTQVLKLQF